eukprot:651921-Alexandrium_andersonii.AAC.1
MRPGSWRHPCRPAVDQTLLASRYGPRRLPPRRQPCGLTLTLPGPLGRLRFLPSALLGVVPPSLQRPQG